MLCWYSTINTPWSLGHLSSVVFNIIKYDCYIVLGIILLLGKALPEFEL